MDYNTKCYMCMVQYVENFRIITKVYPNIGLY